jgi:hypothetical protein
LGDPLPDGKGWEHIEEIKTGHPYLQIWCMVEKLNLKAALVHKRQVFRITPKPIRPDDLNGIRKLLRNLDNHYYLMDEGSDIKENHFGTVSPTLEETVPPGALKYDLNSTKTNQKPLRPNGNMGFVFSTLFNSF